MLARRGCESATATLPAAACSAEAANAFQQVCELERDFWAMAYAVE